MDLIKASLLTYLFKPLIALYVSMVKVKTFFVFFGVKNKKNEALIVVKCDTEGC